MTVIRPLWTGLLICTVLMFGARVQAADISTADYQRGSRIAERCVQCHGPNGRASGARIPRLAGQQASYIAQQLQRMREGTWLDKKIIEKDASDPRHKTGARRVNRHMSDVLIGLSDVDIFDVAVYFSAQACRPPALGPGAPPKIEGRCRSCHGASGISTNPHVPNLAGQGKTYLEAQIQAFRDAYHGVSWGGSTERGSKIMQGQAKLLSDEDISGLAAYYAGLPCSP